MMTGDTYVSRQRLYVQPGDTVRVELPYSEVCMHMQVAGQARLVQVTDGRYPMAQILNEDGRVFSFPVGLGEAGFYQDGERVYCYPVIDTGELADRLAYAILLAAFAEYGITREAVTEAAVVVSQTPYLGEPQPLAMIVRETRQGIRESA
jgi:hypothetical protein